MFVGLFTSRIFLNVLGVEDYGIFNVVGGIVIIFTFINSSMSSAIQRFLSFESGRGHSKKLQETFNASLITHISIGIIILIFAIIELYFLFNELNMPENRFEAATWVYHLAVIATFLQILRVLFSASIIANEKMEVYAYMSIAEVSMKLILIYMLTVIEYGKLKLFASLLLVSTVAHNKYKELDISGSLSENDITYDVKGLISKKSV